MRAQEIEWPVVPGWGQPEALVMTNGLDVFLMYPTQEQRHTALLKFLRCKSVKYGSPNDEVFDGWILNQRGVELGGAFVIHDSTWLAELRAINQTHAQFDSHHWDLLKHYVFSMKDYQFECIALDIEIEIYRGDLHAAIGVVSDRLHFVHDTSMK